jgi:hypothetical protein
MIILGSMVGEAQQDGMVGKARQDGMVGPGPGDHQGHGAHSPSRCHAYWEAWVAGQVWSVPVARGHSNIPPTGPLSHCRSLFRSAYGPISLASHATHTWTDHHGFGSYHSSGNTALEATPCRAEGVRVFLHGNDPIFGSRSP